MKTGYAISNSVALQKSLDYTTLDAAAKSVEAKLSEKGQEIEALKKMMMEMESMMHTIGERLELKVVKARQNT